MAILPLRRDPPIHTHWQRAGEATYLHRHWQRGRGWVETHANLCHWAWVPLVEWAVGLPHHLLCWWVGNPPTEGMGCDPPKSPPRVRAWVGHPIAPSASEHLGGLSHLRMLAGDVGLATHPPPSPPLFFFFFSSHFSIFFVFVMWQAEVTLWYTWNYFSWFNVVLRLHVTICVKNLDAMCTNGAI